MSPDEKERLNRIVSMTALGVPDTQIAEAVNLTPGRITQIKDTEEFKDALAVELSRRAEDQAEINDGWDAIERRALQVVQDNLRYNKNPDFALKAAMVANRATRRGTHGGAPLPTNMGPRVIINMQANFVNKLQQLVSSPEGAQVAQSARVASQPLSQVMQPMLTSEGFEKRSDVMLPAQVEKLMVQGSEHLDFDIELVS